MLVRLVAVPLDTDRVRVAFNEDGRPKEVTVEDPILAAQMIVNKRDIAGVNAQCQAQCEAAERNFDAAAKAAELAYQAEATRLRQVADAQIKQAQDDQRAMVNTLVEQRNALEASAFEKAEAQVVAEAVAAE